MVRPPFGRILAYWRAERRTIRHGLTALVVASAGNLVAGITLGSLTGTLDRLPGLMVLLPAAIGMRGNIFGAVGSRLGTSIHAGLFEATRRRSGMLYQNVLAAAVLTFGTSLVLGALAKAVSEAFGITSMSTADFVVVSVLGGVLSSIVLATFTAFVSVVAFRRGWDLDSVTAPLVTAAGDIITIPALYLATYAVGIEIVTPGVALAMAAVSLAFVVRGLTTDLAVTRRVVRESIVLHCVAGLVDILAGVAIESRLEHFITYPVLLVLIPPLLADAGAMGGILSSRLASKLHLGALDPRAKPQAVALLDTTIVLLFAVWIFALLGLAADVVAGVFGMASPGAWQVIGISLTAGMLATLFAVVIAYYSAVATYRLGADPDSHGIPVITSSMDLIGVICLMIALVTFGIV